MTWLRIVRISIRLGLGAFVASMLLVAALWALAPPTGHREVVIRSGSMSPAIPAGSLAILETIDPSELRVGDVVTVQLVSGGYLTHRVAQPVSHDGHRLVVLHGDANGPAVTESINADQVVGRVAAVLPGLGYLAWWLSRPSGIVACFALVGLSLVLIDALRPPGPRRFRRRPSMARLGGTRLGRGAAVLDSRIRIGVHSPLAVLVLLVSMAIGGGAAAPSAAIFGASADIDGNSFTTGTWPSSDYRSVASGDWGVAGTWERFNGTAWVAAGRPPSSIDGVVTIRTGHTVTATADVVVDQVVVSAGAQLVAGIGATVTVADGAGTDLDDFGTVSTNGRLTLGAGSSAMVEPGALLLDAGLVDGTGSIRVSAGTIQAVAGARTIGNPVVLTGGLTVSGGQDLALNGQVSGAGSLTKDGAGTLTLGALNTYSGATTVSAGTLMLGVANAVGSASAVTVAGGAVFDLHGYSDTIGSLAGAGATTSAAPGAVTLTSGGNNSSTAVSGLIADGSGQLSLTKTGTGTLTLSGVNTYSGITTISAGTVSIAADSALGTAPGAPTAGQLTIGAATLATTATFSLDPNRGISLTAGGTISATGTLTYGGIVAGPGALTKTGAGTLTLAGVNTYSGITTISAGTVSIGADSALGTAPGAPTAGQLTIGAATLATTATFSLDPNRGISLTAGGTISATGTLTYGGIVAGPGALTKTGAGTLTLSGVNTYSGITTISAGTVSIAADSALGTAPASPTAGSLVIGAGTLVTTSTFTLDPNRGINLTGAATVSPAGTLTYAGIVAGAGSLTKIGANTLVLSGVNTYTGVTTLSAGVIRVQSSAALGTTAGGTTVASGAALEIDGTGLVLADPITSVIGAGVGGNGAVRNLANANTWSGTITLGAGGARINSDGGTLTLGAIGGATRPLTVGGAGNTVIGGVIATTTGSLTKDGAGNLTLGAVNTYTGVTTVSTGTLLVNGSTAGGAVTIASGATLGGSGTIGGTVNVSGTLSPGGVPGRLITGALTLSANSAYAVEIGGTIPASGYDQTRVSSGAVTINNTTTLSLAGIGGFSPSIGQTFTILDKVAPGAIVGTFAGLPEGTTVTNFLGTGAKAQISYLGGDGNDIVLTVIP